MNFTDFMLPFGRCQKSDREISSSNFCPGIPAAAATAQFTCYCNYCHHQHHNVHVYNCNSDSLSSLISDSSNKRVKSQWRTWRKDSDLELAAPEGMSASLSYKLWRSTTGLDNAGMDLRVAQFSARTNQEFLSAKASAGLEQQLPILVALCAIVGAVLFAFLILLWLRQQMSREKDAEEGDRRGLVEEGRVCQPTDEVGKTSKTKVLTEVKWVAEPVPETSAASATPLALETKVVATSDKVTTQLEKVKVQTESQWLPDSSPRSSTTSHPEFSRCSSTRWLTMTTTTASTSSMAASLRTATATSTISSSSMSRMAKFSPRREGNRRTLSMYSPHVSVLATPERKPDTQRRAKNLLERRGSSASLTIDLGPATESPPYTVTPTREYTAEEFLLSASKPLTRVQLKKAINDPSSLHKEFWEVPLNYPEEVDVCGSGVKNRYRSVLPNARSRVVLPGSDDPLTSYINANYVRGYDDDARYIATQGPLSHTIQDFWSMAWSEKTPVIVMMTRLHEATKTKCEAYFPLEINSRLQAGPFTVILNSMDTRGGYTVRDLEVRHENERRIIQHYWYDSWPDHAVPQTADALVGLAAEINTLPGPIIVHCSAGIGRTGCFIALATGMTQLIREGSADVLGTVCQMRYDRGGMVQTAEQYEFIHKALCLFEETLESKTSKDYDCKAKPK